MAIATAAQLAVRIGGNKTEADVQGAYDEAKVLLDEATTDVLRPVPEGVYNLCLLRVGYACWDAAKSSAGTKQVTTMEGQVPVRSPRDSLASVRGILANYVAPFA